MVSLIMNSNNFAENLGKMAIFIYVSMHLKWKIKEVNVLVKEMNTYSECTAKTNLF